MQWQAKPGTYLAGDKAIRGKDGYWQISGRTMTCSRFPAMGSPTPQVESAAALPRVARAAVIVQPDEVLGLQHRGLLSSSSPACEESEELEEGDLHSHGARCLGPEAYPDRVFFVKDVPKTVVRQDHAPRHQGPWPLERRPETCPLWPTPSP